MRLSLIGLAVISQVGVTYGQPAKSQSSKDSRRIKPLDTSLSPDFYLRHAAELSQKIDLVAVFNQAKETEPEIAKAIGEIEAAFYNIEAEKNRRAGPTINLAAGVSYSQVPISGWKEQIGITFDKTLWSVPQDKLIERAKVDLSRSEIESQIKLQQLIATVVDSYMNILKNKEIMEISDEQIAYLERHRDYVKDQYEVGLESKPILAKIEAALLATEQSKEAAIKDYENAINNISVSWDVDVDQLAKLKKNIKFAPPVPSDPVKWKEIMLANSLIFSRDAKVIEGIQLDIEKERAELSTPKVSFNAGCSLADTSYDLASGQNQSGCNVGLNITQPLYNGGYTNSKTKSLGAKKGVAMSDLDKDRRKSLATIENSLRNIKFTIKSIEQFKSIVALSKDAAQGINEQFENGLAMSLQVVDSVTSKLSYERQLIGLKYDYFTHEVELKLAAGTLSIVDLLEINQMLE
jgi:outer membrane protein